MTGILSDDLTFKKTRNVDSFDMRSVMSEVSAVVDAKQSNVITVRKADIDEVLLKVAEMVYV